MKTRLFLLILFLLASIYLNPILADLAVDQGPSWSFGKEEQTKCPDINSDRYYCKTIKWLVLGDESYKSGNFNEALERYSNALTQTQTGSDQPYPYVIKNHMGDVLFKQGKF